MKRWLRPIIRLAGLITIVDALNAHAQIRPFQNPPTLTEVAPPIGVNNLLALRQHT